MSKPRTIAEIEADQSAVQSLWVEALGERQAISERVERLSLKKSQLVDELLEALKKELRTK
jgi:hypothetical protein